MKKCVMIYNSKSGKKKSDELLPEFEKILDDKGYELILKVTKKRGHAERIVKELEDDIDLVIAAGGDGTFNEVISGNLKREKKLLIADLPLGSTNDVATMYGLDKDSIENLKLLLDGKIKNIDICKINNKAFIYFAGVGSFVNVTYETPRRLKEKYGRTAYFIYALKQFNGKVKDYDITYEVNDKKYRGNYSFIFITNSSSVAGVNNIYPDVKLDDNKFEVLLCQTKSKLKLIQMVSKLKKQDIRTIEGLTYYKTNKFKITFDEIPEDSWCLDGEEMKHNNKTFEFCISKEVNVLLPKVNINKLFV
ncbi:MAG: diacylglycerol kinase family lipid kinase [Bacilli bacterium]|nr:diacylglycerol kinase family lipid kinase [Bacilli bacterium]